MPKLPKTLPYGKSPFDYMTEAELRLFAKRAYWALVSARSVMRLSQGPDSSSPFWREGTGGHGLALTEAVIHAVGYDNQGRKQEDLWRAYYRPALPALFTDARLPNGDRAIPPWWLCEDCNKYTSPDKPEKCHFCGSTRIREMTLTDVENPPETPT